MEKYITLYHYSNANFSGYIRPEFFGSNNYTNFSARISGIKKIFFYTRPGIKENFLSGKKYLYIGRILEKKLYDIEADKKNIIPGAAGHDIYSILKNKKYSGALGNNGYPVAAVFYKVKILKKVIY